MPKRQSKKTNSSASPEISAPQQPAIVRIVKQNIPATSTNSPEPSASTAAEMATVNVEELTQTDSSKAIELAQPERENKLPQLEKRIPPYQKLETVNNSQGQTFAVGDEIQVSTCNFGSQQAVITFLYSAPDGNIWATYQPLTKDQWRRGCCRIEYLQKLDENVSSGLE